MVDGGSVGRSQERLTELQTSGRLGDGYFAGLQDAGSGGIRAQAIDRELGRGGDPLGSSGVLFDRAGDLVLRSYRTAKGSAGQAASAKAGNGPKRALPNRTLERRHVAAFALQRDVLRHLLGGALGKFREGFSPATDQATANHVLFRRGYGTRHAGPGQHVRDLFDRNNVLYTHRRSKSAESHANGNLVFVLPQVGLSSFGAFFGLDLRHARAQHVVLDGVVNRLFGSTSALRCTQANLCGQARDGRLTNAGQQGRQNDGHAGAQALRNE